MPSKKTVGYSAKDLATIQRLQESFYLASPATGLAPHLEQLPTSLEMLPPFNITIEQGSFQVFENRHKTETFVGLNDLALSLSSEELALLLDHRTHPFKVKKLLSKAVAIKTLMPVDEHLKHALSKYVVRHYLPEAWYLASRAWGKNPDPKIVASCPNCKEGFVYLTAAETSLPCDCATEVCLLDWLLQKPGPKRKSASNIFVLKSDFLDLLAILHIVREVRREGPPAVLVVNRLLPYDESVATKAAKNLMLLLDKLATRSVTVLGSEPIEGRLIAVANEVPLSPKVFALQRGILVSVFNEVRFNQLLLSSKDSAIFNVVYNSLAENLLPNLVQKLATGVSVNGSTLLFDALS